MFEIVKAITSTIKFKYEKKIKRLKIKIIDLEKELATLNKKDHSNDAGDVVVNLKENETDLL